MLIISFFLSVRIMNIQIFLFIIILLLVKVLAHFTSFDEQACFICKQKLHWRCVRCPIASHDKCAPWPDQVRHFESQPGKAVCWRHPSDWRLDRKVKFSFPLSIWFHYYYYLFEISIIRVLSLPI